MNLLTMDLTFEKVAETRMRKRTKPLALVDEIIFMKNTVRIRPRYRMMIFFFFWVAKRGLEKDKNRSEVICDKFLQKANGNDRTGALVATKSVVLNFSNCLVNLFLIATITSFIED